MNLPCAVDLFQQCQVSRYSLLKNSKDPRIISVYSKLLETTHSSARNPHWNAPRQLEALINRVSHKFRGRKASVCRKLVSDEFKRVQAQSKLDKIFTKNMHSNMIKKVLEMPEMNLNYDWISCLVSLPPRILKFRVNASINCLPSPDNLKRWKIARKLPTGHKVISSECSLCGSPNATLTHILNACPYSLDDLNGNRIKWRHDSVLKEMIDNILPLLPKSSVLYCDLPSSSHHYGARIPLIDTSIQRPDIILVDHTLKSIILGELTCPSEDRCSASHTEKFNKYVSLAKEYSDLGFTVSNMPFEISSRGIACESSITFLCSIGIKKKQVKTIINSLCRKATDCSYNIFCARDNISWNPSHPSIF